MVARRARKTIAAGVAGVGLVLALVGPAVAVPMEGLSVGAPRPGSASPPASQTAAGTPLPMESVLPSCSGPPVTTSLDPATQWDSIVLDPVRGLPPGWAPDDVVAVPSLGTDNGAEVREFILEPLLAMHAAATAAGSPFGVSSGYRSQSRQEKVFHKATEAPTTPDEPLMVAPPGHSEHQLGTTVDLVDPSDRTLTTAFADTPAGEWVAEHAVEFGFVVSYPEDAQHESCYGWEPWHLRYVGTERAREMATSGLAPRAFLLLEASTAKS